MGLAKVWNENKYPYREKFEGKDVEIEPGGYVIMNDKEAIRFKGTYAPPRVDGMGRPDPLYFKMLRLEEHNPANEPVVHVEPSKKFICQKDGQEFDSLEELEAYEQKNYLDDLLDQELADEIRKGKKKK